MNSFLNHTVLNVPLYTWILQLAYVVVALSILFAFATVHKRTTVEILLFVICIIVIDIIWRLAIK